MNHISVLLKESIEGLNIKQDGFYVDGTCGRAGHASVILRNIPNGHLYGFDKDEQAIKEGEIILNKIGRNFTLIQLPFSQMKTYLNSIGINKVDGILLDLGVSSPQFDDSKRGFSYRYDARLDMRMDLNQSLSAYEVVNTYSFHDLKRIFFAYGEEKHGLSIARAIERERDIKPIETTLQLVEVIRMALPAKVLKQKGHPAKKVFQAIRIEVNHELEELQKVLIDGLELLNKNGRICVISFHSLEDRIVKVAFKEVSSVAKVNKRLPINEKEQLLAPYRLVNRKAQVASEEEQNVNKRSHSAKLRIIEKR